MRYFRKQFGPDWCIIDVGLAHDLWYHRVESVIADQHKRTQVISVFWDTLDYKTMANGKAQGLYIVFFGLLIGVLRVKEGNGNQ